MGCVLAATHANPFVRPKLLKNAKKVKFDGPTNKRMDGQTEGPNVTKKAFIRFFILMRYSKIGF